MSSYFRDKKEVNSAKFGG